MSKTLTSTQRRELRASVNDWRTTLRGYARVQAQIEAQRGGFSLDFGQDGPGSGPDELEHDLARMGELRHDY